MQKRKNPAAVALGRRGAKRRFELGGVEAMREMSKKGVEARRAKRAAQTLVETPS